MALTVWRITDGKAGHDSQTVGLCNAIKKIKDINSFDIKAEPAFSNFKSFLLNQFPLGKELPDPDLIIGAGHGCHLTMLSAKKVRGGKTIVLMKPSLPLSLFDLCIIPEHDQVKDKGNVITTKGAINPVQFNENKSNDSGLFLIGGPSKHYYWDEKEIVRQIKEIIKQSSDIRWTIADSPRTPEKTRSLLADLNNIEVLSYENTDSDKLREFIFKSGSIWVSEDSVSMAYESLSSGAAVGLLNVKQKTQNRISNSINSLINRKQLTSFSSWEKTNKLLLPTNKFNEADRCVKQLLERELLA
ncbi:MAG: mitochondrial fission ELM1 family protein [Gammaproteobacteria bacterium]|jgi:mitochondrial fission protein ELM1